MHKGFSLIEIVITIGVIAIMSVVLTQVFIMTVKTNTKAEISKEVKQNGDFALDNITRALQNSRKILSTCGVSQLKQTSIRFLNPDGGITEYECREDGDVLRIASTSGDTPSYLTAPSVTLVGADCTSSIYFYCQTTSDANQNVQITFSLAQKGTSPKTYEEASQNFSTTVTLRN